MSDGTRVMVPVWPCGQVGDAFQVVPPPLTRRQRHQYPSDEFVKAYASSESTPEEEVVPSGVSVSLALDGT